jgi:hypothetical protein
VILAKLKYATGELVTTPAAAAAVMEYAEMLGNTGRAANVFVPAVGLPAGTFAVELLIGPASQLASEPVESDEPAPDDTVFLSRMAQQSERETTTRVWSDDDWSYDL